MFGEIWTIQKHVLKIYVLVRFVSARQYRYNMSMRMGVLSEYIHIIISDTFNED